MTTTSEDLALRLRTGRILKGRLLALAVVVREAALGLAFGGLSGGLAPSWVQVRDRHTGKSLFEVAAGREAKAGTELLAAMTADAEKLSTDDFIKKWSS